MNSNAFCSTCRRGSPAASATTNDPSGALDGDRPQRMSCYRNNDVFAFDAREAGRRTARLLPAGRDRDPLAAFAFGQAYDVSARRRWRTHLGLARSMKSLPVGRTYALGLGRASMMFIGRISAPVDGVYGLLTAYTIDQTPHCRGV